MNRGKIVSMYAGLKLFGVSKDYLATRKLTLNYPDFVMSDIENGKSSGSIPIGSGDHGMLFCR